MPDSGVHREMAAALRAQFPGIRITSTYREGSITSTGNRSYHAQGKAVDMEPSREIFDWIRAKYPSSRELIFSPAEGKQIRNGQPHVYSGVTRAEHYDHVHWAVNSLAEASQPAGAQFVNAGFQGSNPVIPDEIEAIGAFYKFITNPGTWARVGIAIGGAVLLIVAYLSTGRKILELP